MRPTLGWVAPAVLLGLLGVGVAPARAAEEKLPSILSSAPLQPGAQADEVRKLLIARYNAALAEIQKRYKGAFRGPHRELDVAALVGASERLRTAGLELSSERGEQVKVYETALELAKHLERLAEAADRNGLSKSPADLDSARYNRLDAEIRLARAKSKVVRPER